MVADLHSHKYERIRVRQSFRKSKQRVATKRVRKG